VGAADVGVSGVEDVLDAGAEAAADVAPSPGWSDDPEQADSASTAPTTAATLFCART